MAIPQVNSLIIDGVSSNGISTIAAEPGIHTVEINGAAFLNGRIATPEVVGRTQVAIIPLVSNRSIAGIQCTEILAVSDTYLRFQLSLSEGVAAGIYRIAVMNDFGISPANNLVSQCLRLSALVPMFLTAQTIYGISGQVITVGIDSYDPIRDANLKILVNGAPVFPSSIGNQVDDKTLVQQAFSALFGRLPSAAELNAYVVFLSTNSRSQLAAQIQQDYNSTVNFYYWFGTPVRVPIVCDSAAAISLRTDNGISDSHIFFIPNAAPPSLPPSGTSAPFILFVTPQSAVPSSTVTIIGGNFTANTKIYLGSTLLSTNFVSSTEIQFSLSATTPANRYALIATDTTGTATYSYFTFLNPDAVQPAKSTQSLITGLSPNLLNVTAPLDFQGGYTSNLRGFPSGNQRVPDNGNTTLTQPSFNLDAPAPLSSISYRSHAPVPGRTRLGNVWRNYNATPLSSTMQADFVPLDNSAKNTMNGVITPSLSAPPPARVANPPLPQIVTISKNGQNVPNPDINGHTETVHSLKTISDPGVVRVGIIEHIDLAPKVRGGGI